MTDPITPQTEVPAETTEESAVVDTPAEEATETTEAVSEEHPTEPAPEADLSAETETDSSDANAATDQTAASDDESTETDTEEEEETLPTFDTVEEAARYVKELREENKRRRLQNKDVDAAFEGAPEGFREGWTEIARLLNGSEEEQEAAVGLLARFIGAENTDESEDDGDVETAEPAPTLADAEERILSKVSAMFDERNQKLAVSREQAKIAVELEQLGYKAEAAPGTPEFASHALLWQIVAAQPDGEKSIEEAHKQVQAYEETVFNRKLEEARTANTGLPPALGGVTTDAQDVQDEPVSARDVMKQAEQESIRRAQERKAAPRF